MCVCVCGGGLVTDEMKNERHLHCIALDASLFNFSKGDQSAEFLHGWNIFTAISFAPL